MAHRITSCSRPGRLGPTASRIVGGILAPCLILAACRGNSESELIETRRDEATTAPLTLVSDSCAVALAPDGAVDEHRNGLLDRRIDESQRILKAAERPSLPYLERLGWSFIAKARASFDAAYYTLALKTAECLHAVAASSSEALLLQGHALHSLHRFSEAREVAARLVTQRGRWFDHGLLGDTLLELGRMEEAVHAYQSMMDERPGPESYARAARVRWLTGDVEGAAAMMRAAVRAMGGREAEPLAWALVKLAKYESVLAQTESAKRSVQRALAIHPDYPPALLEHARLLLAEGRAGESVTALRRTAALHSLPELQWALVEALEQSGAPEAARAVAARLVSGGARLDPRTVSLFLASRHGGPEQALSLSAAELETRRDVYTLDAHAWALLTAGRSEEALEFARRALAFGTRDARLAYHAGVILARAGQLESARSQLRLARELQDQLWPSERQGLLKEFAAVLSQTHPDGGDEAARQQPLTEEEIPT